MDFKKLSDDYNSTGYAIARNFLNDQEVEALRNESSRLVREEWTKEGDDIYIFGNAFNAKSLYFLESSDKVRYFAEKKAYDFSKNQLIGTREHSISKIGHALHCLNPVFKEVTCSQKVKEVFAAIQFKNPTVAQSMVIFKNPKVGGAYTPHQDASFLNTEPIHLAGLWIALDDATKENGCLEFIPGSHRWPLARRFVRSKERKQDDDDYLEWTAPVVQYQDDQFVMEPVKRGDMVLIHGLVVHRSGPNVSEKARWVYTFHAYDEARGEYQSDNWLQPGPNNTFLPIFEN